MHHHLGNVISVEAPFVIAEVFEHRKHQIQTFVDFHHAEMQFSNIIAITGEEGNYCEKISF